MDDDNNLEDDSSSLIYEQMVSPQRNLSPVNNRSRSWSNERKNDQNSNQSRENSRNRENRSRSRSQSRNTNRSRSPRRSENPRENTGGNFSRDRQRRSDRSSRDRGGNQNGNNRTYSQRDAQKDRELGLKYRWEKTVYVSNVSYDTRWSDLKDLFREKVGDVMFCQVFEKDGRSMGVGVVEFKAEKDAERAVKVMHQYELGGRKLAVRIDGEGYKTRQAKEDSLKGNLSQNSRQRDSDNQNSRNSNQNNRSRDSNSDINSSLALAQVLQNGQNGNGQNSLMSLLGLNTSQNTIQRESLNPQDALLNQLAAQLKVDGPVTNRLFVASLDYKVDEKKLKEVFSLAGKVESCEMFRNRDGESRGMAVIEFDTKISALNAVSMFNQQVLMDRQMSVRFDEKPPTEDELYEKQKAKLPSGLKSIGKGISLPSQNSNDISNGSLGLGLGMLNSLGINLQNNNGNDRNTQSLMSLNSNNGQSNQSNGNNYNQSRSSGSRSRNTIKQIFVKNIPFSWDKTKLKDKFRSAGRIEHVDIKMKDGKSRGCALIHFETPDHAVKAVELFSGSRFDGRTLEVNLDKMA